MRHALLPTVLVAAALFVPAGAVAQECLGLPTRDGQISVGAFGGGLDGETQYGGEFGADVSGPAAFAISYGGLGAEGDRQVFSARASYDFFLLEPAVCAVAGVVYDNAPAAGVNERLGVPAGIGIGKTLRGTAFSTTVFAVPQYVWMREERATVPPGDAMPLEETVTSNEFMAEAGVTLGFLPFYVGGSVVVATFNDGDPSFRIRAGLTF